MKTISEPERKIPVVEEADVIVAGGGLAGVAAAVSAARNGAEVIVIERNGFLGGVATAGLMSSMGNGFFADGERQIVKGIAHEMIKRLADEDGTSAGWRRPLVPKIPFDPEIFKLVLLEIVEEENVKLYLHTLVSDAIRSENRLEGIIVESKSGREAILGRVVVDATGDADIAAKAGAPFIYNPPGSSSLEFRMGNVDLQKTYEYFKEEPGRYPFDVDVPRTFEEFERNWLENGFFYYPHGGGGKPGSNIAVLVEKAIERGKFSKEMGITTGLDAFGMDGLGWNRTVVVNSNFSKIDDLDVRLESRAEVEARKACFYVANFLKMYLPGFEESFIIATAPDLGVRVTRSIIGEHIFTNEERNRGAKFNDVIGVGPLKGFPPTFEIPYRCMIPKGIEEILVVSGKSASTQPRGMLRGMTTCIILGQAAGTAAALATTKGISLSRLDIQSLQTSLVKQNVYLGDEDRLGELRLPF
jgi:hypothetical protein